MEPWPQASIQAPLQVKAVFFLSLFLLFLYFLMAGVDDEAKDEGKAQKQDLGKLPALMESWKSEPTPGKHEGVR